MDVLEVIQSELKQKMDFRKPNSKPAPKFQVPKLHRKLQNPINRLHCWKLQVPEFKGAIQSSRSQNTQETFGFQSFKVNSRTLASP